MSEYSSPTHFIDLSAQQKLIRQQLELAILRVLDHGQYIMGPEVKEFESDLQKYTGARHAITCANGTDALSLVLMAWGVGPGDAVFVPSFTYVATAEAPAQLGATPFFVDVCEETFNIDPISFKQAIFDCRELGLKAAVVIPVDLFGLPADIDTITDIAHSEGIKVLVDGAQSFGATANSRRVGSMGDATTTSFFPAKPLGCFGDGGAVFTNSKEDADMVRSISLHGKGDHKYENINIGVNSRLDTLQAAVLIEKLKILPRELVAREKIASQYEDFMGAYIRIPKCNKNISSAWALYTIQTEHRELIQDNLKSKDIPSIIYYPIPLSEQKAYKNYPAVSTGLEISSALSRQVLSLPMHPYLEKDDILKISNTVIQSLDSI